MHDIGNESTEKGNEGVDDWHVSILREGLMEYSGTGKFHGARVTSFFLFSWEHMF